MALLHSARYQQSLRRYQAQRVRRRDLNKGDLVLRLRQDNRRHKLSPPWEGLYVIAKVLKPGTYKLANADAKSSPTLGTYSSYVASILRVPSYFVHHLYSHFRFPKIINEYTLLVYFWEPSGPSKARMRTNTKVRLALPSAKPSLPRGYYGANPRTFPKIANVFSKYFRLVSKLLVYLEKTDARRKQLRYGAGRVVGPPTPHHPTPMSLMNAKFLAEVYLSRIREHGNKVKKTKARTHKASMGYTVDFNDLTKMNFFIHKYKVRL